MDEFEKARLLLRAVEALEVIAIEMEWLNKHGLLLVDKPTVEEN